MTRAFNFNVPVPLSPAKRPRLRHRLRGCLVESPAFPASPAGASCFLRDSRRSIIVIAKKKANEEGGSGKPPGGAHDLRGSQPMHPVLEAASVGNRTLADFLFAFHTIHDASRPELLHLWRLLGKVYDYTYCKNDRRKPSNGSSKRVNAEIDFALEPYWEQLAQRTGEMHRSLVPQDLILIFRVLSTQTGSCGQQRQGHENTQDIRKTRDADAELLVVEHNAALPGAGEVEAGFSRLEAQHGDSDTGSPNANDALSNVGGTATASAKEPAARLLRLEQRRDPDGNLVRNATRTTRASAHTRQKPSVRTFPDLMLLLHAQTKRLYCGFNVEQLTDLVIAYNLLNLRSKANLHLLTKRFCYFLREDSGRVPPAVCAAASRVNSSGDGCLTSAARRDNSFRVTARNVRNFVGVLGKLGILGGNHGHTPTSKVFRTRNEVFTPNNLTLLPDNHAEKGKKYLCRDPADRDYNAFADLFFLVAERFLPQRAVEMDLRGLGIVLNAFARLDAALFRGYDTMLNNMFERCAAVASAKIALVSLSSGSGSPESSGGSTYDKRRRRVAMNADSSSHTPRDATETSRMAEEAADNVRPSHSGRGAPTQHDEPAELSPGHEGTEAFRSGLRGATTTAAGLGAPSLVKLEELLLSDPATVLAERAETQEDRAGASRSSASSSTNHLVASATDAHAPATARDLSLIANAFARTNRRMQALPIFRAIADYALPLYFYGSTTRLPEELKISRRSHSGRDATLQARARLDFLRQLDPATDLPILHPNQAHDIALLLNACAKLDVFEKDVFDVLAPLISKNVTKFAPQGLSQVAHAYAKLDVKNEALFEKIAQFAMRISDTLSPQGLANICYAFAKAKTRHDELFAQFRDEIVYRGTVGRERGRKNYDEEARREVNLETLSGSNSDNSGGLRRVVDGIASSTSRACSRTQKALFEWNVQSLEQVAQAYARLGYYDQRLFFVIFSLLRSEVEGMRHAREKLEGARVRRLRTQLEKSAVRKFWENQREQQEREKARAEERERADEEARQKLGIDIDAEAVGNGKARGRKKGAGQRTKLTSEQYRAHREKIREQVEKQLRKITTGDKNRRPSAGSGVGANANRGSSAYTPLTAKQDLSAGCVTSLLQSFVRSKMPLPAFLRWLQQPLLHFHSFYSSHQLASLWQALGKLGKKNRPLFRLLRKEVKPLIPQMAPRSLVVLLQALAKTNTYDRFLMRQCTKICQLRILDFEGSDLMQLLTAFSELQFREVKFLRMLAIAFLKKVQDGGEAFPAGQICAAVRAYANLRVRHPDFFDSCLDALEASVFAEGRKWEKERSLGKRNAAGARSNLWSEKLTEKEAVFSLHALVMRAVSDKVYVQHLALAQEQWAGDKEVVAGAGDGRRVTASQHHLRARQEAASLVARHSILLSDVHSARSADQAALPAKSFELMQSLLRVAHEHRRELKYQSVYQLQLCELFLRFLCEERVYDKVLNAEAKELLKKARHVQLTVDDYMPHSSRMHRVVSSYLSRVGLQHRSEVQLGPYSLDVVIGNDFVLEIDGPSHFYRETNTRLPASLLKHSLLRALGFKVRHLAWQDWLQCTSKQRKLLYAASLWREILPREVLRSLKKGRGTTTTRTGVQHRGKQMASGDADAEEVFVDPDLASADLEANVERDLGEASSARSAASMLSEEDERFLRSPEMTDVLELVNQKRQDELTALQREQSEAGGSKVDASEGDGSSTYKDKLDDPKLFSRDKRKILRALPGATATRLQSIVTDVHILNEDLEAAPSELEPDGDDQVSKAL